MTGLQALRDALRAALTDNARLRVVGEAVGLSPVTAGLSADFPDRVHALPASDATLAGVALGMAMNGDTVVVELAGPESVPAAAAALDAVEASSDCPLAVVFRVPVPPGRPDAAARALGGAGAPHRNVVAIGRPEDAAGALRGLIDARQPAFLFEPLDVLARPVVGQDAVDVQASALLRAGAHATVLAWGASVPEALRAADTLATEGISVDVVDLRSLSVDRSELPAERVRETGRAVIATTAGFDRAQTALVQGAFLRLEAPIELACGHDDIVHSVQTAVHY